MHLSNLRAHGWLIAIGICILAIAVVHLTAVSVGAFLVEIGLFCVFPAILIRKFRPQRMGELYIFQVPEWVAFLVMGIMMIAVGIFVIIATQYPYGF